MFDIKIKEKSFDSNKVIEGFEFKFELNKIYTIFAPNGSGKSTLIEIISGLDPFYTGEIILKDKKVINPINNDVSVMPQNYQSSLLPWYTVEKNLNFPKLEKDYLRLATDLGILKCKDKIVSTLSEGYKQRVAVAKCLIKKSIIYILDEPLSALDYWDKNAIRNCIKNKMNENNCIITITHDIQDAFELSSIVLLFPGGFAKNHKMIVIEKSQIQSITEFINIITNSSSHETK